ncbi:DNA polymerase lambda [Apiospora arundinis]|uniref:DNA-directed DNA polymerase n=1 Tax=Apiospora arundinis TaxID=335852 RepID=A0ABR2J638_9PEZI
MDPTLGDKVAFFQELQTFQAEDGDEDSWVTKDTHRNVIKAFMKAASGATSRSKGSNAVRPINQVVAATQPFFAATPTRTASDPILRTKNGETGRIIKSTPPNSHLVPHLRKTASEVIDVSTISDTPIPDSTKASTKQPPQRRVSDRLLRRRDTGSPSVQDTPSFKMPPKRKKDAPIKMVPESERCFAGLTFFFFPNSDANGVRKKRIDKSREFGATWTRSLKEATHIVVDKGLTYADLESLFEEGGVDVSKKIVVNADFPIDCWTHKVLVSHSQEKYQVPGNPAASQQLDVDTTALSPQSSVQSLKIKEPKSKRERYGISQRITRSGKSSSQALPATPVAQSIEPVVIPDTQPVTAPRPRTSSSSSNSSAEHTPIRKRPQRKAAQSSEKKSEVSAFDDELSQCIGHIMEFGDDVVIPGEDEDASPQPEDGEEPSKGPGDVDGADDEEETYRSENERPAKKTRTSRTSARAAKGTEGWQSTFACMKGGLRGVESKNPNAGTIDTLLQLADQYAKMGSEPWRTTAYRKAAGALKRQSVKINTYAEAIALDDIGESTAQKIEEIARTGRVRKLQDLQSDPLVQLRDVFTKIYGVGAGQADRWIAKGYRTLNDVREKAQLTANQRIGLDHYDDLNTRIPRKEVEALGAHVTRAARAINHDVQLIIGGSYRRGADSSGDIDIIITRQGTSSTGQLIDFLDELVSKLTDEGFLTVALSSHHKSHADDTKGSKWHGCCVLPEDEYPSNDDDGGAAAADTSNTDVEKNKNNNKNKKWRPIWRRIDLLLVPESELGAALIYFTGNDIFNRSMRLLAQKKGMRLNQRGLYKDVLRGRGNVKITEGELVEGEDERKIFRHLGVHWREPHERWC